MAEIRVPDLGDMGEAGVAVTTWFKKLGDPVVADELLLEIETDKATMEVRAPASGVLKEILAPAGETVQLSALLGTIDEEVRGSASSPADSPQDELGTGATDDFLKHWALPGPSMLGEVTATYSATLEEERGTTRIAISNEFASGLGKLGSHIQAAVASFGQGTPLMVLAPFGESQNLHVRRSGPTRIELELVPDDPIMEALLKLRVEQFRRGQVLVGPAMTADEWLDHANYLATEDGLKDVEARIAAAESSGSEAKVGSLPDK